MAQTFIVQIDLLIIQVLIHIQCSLCKNSVISGGTKTVIRYR